MVFDKSSKTVHAAFVKKGDSGRMRFPILSAALLCGAALAQTATPAAPPATPLTLDAALQSLAQSPSVTQAALSVQVAQTNLNAARTARGLSVSVNGNATYTGPYSTTANGTPTSVPGDLGGSAGVQVSLGILPWSSNQYGLYAAQRALNLSQAQLRSSELTARLNVAQQYFGAVLAQQELELATRTLAQRQRELTVRQAQQSAGNATTEAVLNAQANVQAAQGTQLQATSSLDTAQRGLSAALGREIGNVSFSSRPADTLTLPDVAALVASARAGRPEVIDAQNDLAAAQEALEQQERAVKLPDVTASARYGPAGSGGLSTSLNLQAGTASVGYSVPFGNDSTPNRVVASISGSYTVFSPAQKAQLSAAQAAVTQARLTLSVQQQNVELDVRSKYSTLQIALLTAQSKVSAVQVAQSTLATARTRLQAGTATADDVTAAELGVAQAERDLLAARISAQLALISLQNAAVRIN